MYYVNSFRPLKTTFLSYLSLDLDVKNIQIISSQQNKYYITLYSITKKNTALKDCIYLYNYS